MSPNYVLQRTPGTFYVSTYHRGPAPLNTALGSMTWLTVLALGAGLAALLYFNRGPVHRTSEEVLSVLEGWVGDTLSPGAWDYFESCELSDLRLEEIRRACVALSIDPEFTFNPKKSPRLNDAGRAKVLALISELRQSRRD